MPPEHVTVRIPNGKFPSYNFAYKRDDDELGYTAKVSVWLDDLRADCGHSLEVRQGSPIGQIYLILDDCGHGCWSMGDIEGVGITERDLQWAALWAIEAIRRKHSAGIEGCKIPFE